MGKPVQTEESVAAHADRCGKLLNATLPEGVGYVLVVASDTGILVWNTSMRPKKEAAALFRAVADDLEENGCPPDSELDG